MDETLAGAADPSPGLELLSSGLGQRSPPGLLPDQWESVHSTHLPPWAAHQPGDGARSSQLYPHTPLGRGPERGSHGVRHSDRPGPTGEALQDRSGGIRESPEGGPGWKAEGAGRRRRAVRRRVGRVGGRAGLGRGHLGGSHAPLPRPGPDAPSLLQLTCTTPPTCGLAPCRARGAPWSGPG